MNFDLFTIWAREGNEPEAVWCVDAWDEFSVDRNESGWQEAVAKAEAANDEVRVIIVTIQHEAVLNSFTSARINGEVR